MNNYIVSINNDSIWKNMQTDSGSILLLNKYEEERSHHHKSILHLEKIKNKITLLIERKEFDLKILYQEIKVKNDQLIDAKLNILKPLKSMSNYFENKKIKNEILPLLTNKEITHEEIKKLQSQLTETNNEIRSLSIQVDNIANEISLIQTQISKGLELFDNNWVPIGDLPKLREIKIGLANNFENISPFDFEYFVARLLQEMGYTTEVTKKTGDYGIDIIAKKGKMIVAVQCKRHNEKNLIGNVLIQQLLGSMQFINASHCIFITTSSFTKNAITQSQNSPIELWDKDTFHDLVRKYLLNCNVDQIFDAIQKEKQKQKEKIEHEKKAIIEKKAEKKFLLEKRKQEKIAKKEIKKQNSDAKKICPRCGGKKWKTRKYCSKCKQELKSERRYDYYY
jgi:HJR/Mrr/RecB family endonuclease